MLLWSQYQNSFRDTKVSNSAMVMFQLANWSYPANLRRAEEPFVAWSLFQHPIGESDSHFQSEMEHGSPSGKNVPMFWCWIEDILKFLSFSSMDKLSRDRSSSLFLLPHPGFKVLREAHWMLQSCYQTTTLPTCYQNMLFIFYLTTCYQPDAKPVVLASHAGVHGPLWVSLQTPPLHSFEDTWHGKSATKRIQKDN